MNSIVMKRFSAYLIDILIVTVISTLISQIPMINPNHQKYSDNYEKLVELEEQYSEDKIEEDEYKEEYIKLNKKLDTYSFPYTVVTVACLFGYFTLFQYFNNGQTIGKKVTKIRLKGKHKKLHFWSCLVRSLLLNSIFINVVSMILLFVTNATGYYYSNYVLSIIESIFMYSTIIVMLFRKDGRALHDLISNTKVVFDKKSNIIEA